MYMRGVRVFCMCNKPNQTKPNAGGVPDGQVRGVLGRGGRRRGREHQDDARGHGAHTGVWGGAILVVFFFGGGDIFGFRPRNKESVLRVMLSVLVMRHISSDSRRSCWHHAREASTHSSANIRFLEQRGGSRWCFFFLPRCVVLCIVKFCRELSGGGFGATTTAAAKTMRVRGRGSPRRVDERVCIGLCFHPRYSTSSRVTHCVVVGMIVTHVFE